MSREQLRELFADMAYKTIKEQVSLSLDTSSYDDIITSINDQNKLYIAIFFFRWCYEEDYDKYFDTFVAVILISLNPILQMAKWWFCYIMKNTMALLKHSADNMMIDSTLTL